jgi:hypothetical protein
MSHIPALASDKGSLHLQTLMSIVVDVQVSLGIASKADWLPGNFRDATSGSQRLEAQ